MKTLEAALKTPGVLAHGVFEGEIGDISFLAENEEGPCAGTRDGLYIEAAAAPSKLRRIADHLDPQPVAAPVIPEGWRLVPVEMTSDQIDKGVMAVIRAGKSGKSIDAQMRFAFEDMVFSAPPAPLRTEADVRKEARLEALEDAVAFIASQRNDTPMTGEEAAVAIRALIEKESQNA